MRRAHTLLTLLVVAAMLLSMLAAALSPRPAAAQAGPCLAPANAIVAENCLPGNPATDWDLSSASSTTIEGFATDISVNKGQTARFKVKTAATAYHIDLYRVGYYGGLGARKIATIPNSATVKQSQPACLNDPTTGLIDCGNWAVSASWTVPATAVSGIYLAKLVREDATPGANHVVFVVRDDDGNAPLLFQTSDTTWQAYNSYGDFPDTDGDGLTEGASLYVNKAFNNGLDRAYKV
ncbi:MAG TPA: N,N-dimethylformamidase beta subunit family domain-containing protein, partial [Chloroflexota bacterium]|nr:N,N-dimethylformamidase beta subunit family domain-containing protein [Chloroflexota bacterium]